MFLDLSLVIFIVKQRTNLQIQPWEQKLKKIKRKSFKKCKEKVFKTGGFFRIHRILSIFFIFHVLDVIEGKLVVVQTINLEFTFQCQRLTNDWRSNTQSAITTRTFIAE